VRGTPQRLQTCSVLSFFRRLASPCRAVGSSSLLHGSPNTTGVIPAAADGKPSASAENISPRVARTAARSDAPSLARSRLSTNATAGAWTWSAGSAGASSAVPRPGARDGGGGALPAPPPAGMPAAPPVLLAKATPSVACRMAWAVRRRRHRETSEEQSCGTRGVNVHCRRREGGEREGAWAGLVEGFGWRDRGVPQKELTARKILQSYSGAGGEQGR
jgi:hypothetical protein